ncbi:hypothetical protein HK100_006748, partial [Physocladia obscura]
MGAQLSKSLYVNLKSRKQKQTNDSNADSAVLSDSSSSRAIKLITSIDELDVTRVYHAVEESEYFLPIDSIEQDRLELQVGEYHLVKSLLSTMPISDVICVEAQDLLKLPGTKVLDVGAAKGWWLDSLLKSYPTAKYFGTDVSPEVVLSASKFLPTIDFSTGNVADGLPYEDNTFDYVHQRFLVLGLAKDKFHLAIRELMRVAKPGGWIELVELDIKGYRSGPMAEKIQSALHEIMKSRNLDLFAGANLHNYLLKATHNNSIRVANARRKTVSLPINWGGPLGTMHGHDCKELYIGLEDALHKKLGIERAEYKEYIEQVWKEWAAYKSFG